MNGCECCTNVCNPQDNDTDYDMGIIVSVPGERVPRKRYPFYWGVWILSTMVNTVQRWQEYLCIELDHISSE